MFLFTLSWKFEKPTEGTRVDFFLSRRKVATRMEAGSAKHPGAAISVWKARRGQCRKGM